MALPRQFVADAVYHVADFLELRVFFEVEENPEGVLDRNDDAEMGHAVPVRQFAYRCTLGDAKRPVIEFQTDDRAYSLQNASPFHYATY